MSSSKPVGRIWRGVDAPRVSAATFAVELPGAARAQAVSMVDTIEEARADGYQRGYAAARQEMEESAEGDRQRRLAAVCDALTAAAGALVDRRSESVAVAELEAVHLAVELAEAIVRRELALGRQPAVEALQRALSLLPTGEDLLVRLHPGDVLDAAELQALVPERQVRVIADDAVEPGGCLVDAGPCHVDAQIGPALARARAVLAGLHPLGAGAAPRGDGTQAEPVDVEPVVGEPFEAEPVVGEPFEAEPLAAEPVGESAEPETADTDASDGMVVEPETADTDASDGMVVEPETADTEMAEVVP